MEDAARLVAECHTCTVVIVFQCITSQASIYEMAATHQAPTGSVTQSTVKICTTSITVESTVGEYTYIR